MKGFIGVMILFLLSLECMGKEFPKQLEDARYAIKSSLLMGIVAKELCSCVYVTGAYKRLGIKKAARLCEKRANLPVSPLILKQFIRIKWDEKKLNIKVTPKALGTIIGEFRPYGVISQYAGDSSRFGCNLDKI